mmetsp:Transcript_21736/g.60736  ORF Transcript_21736/g.60736 Transcript_21736/m.60736 type:complete len:224 (-) Transcript_21736:1171-1842(-)
MAVEDPLPPQLWLRPFRRPRFSRNPLLLWRPRRKRRPLEALPMALALAAPQVSRAQPLLRTPPRWDPERPLPPLPRPQRFRRRPKASSMACLVLHPSRGTPSPWPLPPRRPRRRRGSWPTQFPVQFDRAARRMGLRLSPVRSTPPPRRLSRNAPARVATCPPLPQGLLQPPWLLWPPRPGRLRKRASAATLRLRSRTCCLRGRASRRKVPAPCCRAPPRRGRA